jgi:hypothetical protein
MISGNDCNDFRETSTSNYQKEYNHFYKIANPVKLTLNYIYEMIYETYLYNHYVYILMLCNFNMKIQILINMKDNLLITKLFRFSPVIPNNE